MIAKVNDIRIKVDKCNIAITERNGSGAASLFRALPVESQRFVRNSLSQDSLNWLDAQLLGWDDQPQTSEQKKKKSQI